MRYRFYDSMRYLIGIAAMTLIFNPGMLYYGLGIIVALFLLRRFERTRLICRGDGSCAQEDSPWEWGEMAVMLVSMYGGPYLLTRESLGVAICGAVTVFAGYVSVWFTHSCFADKRCSATYVFTRRQPEP